MNRPKPTSGLRHLALNVINLEASSHFYTELLGMKISWQPDPDNIYLSSGNDILALHRAPKDFQPNAYQYLDHLGFIIDEVEQVDVWHEFLKSHGVTIKAAPRTHRDQSRSFYCYDPDDNVVQFIYEPNVSAS
ncbi:MAG: VOC family protein [Proteobacteria bacterium]|nr:VOC family protein [Pseudomonadota bacterium]